MRAIEMDASDRTRLEKLAMERLYATADDVERWSFAWGGAEAVCLSYCPWSELEDWEFDGTTEGLDLPWSNERLGLIKRGEVSLNEEELRQWRQSMCRLLAVRGEAFTAWIAPVTVDKTLSGYATFLFHYGAAPEDAPTLKGIFATLSEAREALTVDGVAISV
jgi:hypothetical protein